MADSFKHLAGTSGPHVHDPDNTSLQIELESQTPSPIMSPHSSTGETTGGDDDGRGGNMSSQVSSSDSDREETQRQHTISTAWQRLHQSTEPKPHHSLELQLKLCKYLEPCQDQRSFLPIDRLVETITVDAVKKELLVHWGHLPETTLDEVAKDICHRHDVHKEFRRLRFSSCQRLFALFVMCDQVSSVPSLFTEQIDDTYLPFLRIPGADGLFSQKDGGKRILMFDNWSPPVITIFENWQWMLLSPYFSKPRDGLGEKARHYSLKTMDILPWVDFTRAGEVQELPLKNEGSAATVEIKQLHKAHNGFPNLPNNLIARKELKSRDQGLFEKEVRALKRFDQQRNSQRIIQLLATYSQDGRYYLLFPAAAGNLKDFWVQNPPSHTCETFKWLAKESRGIAEGLSQIHRHTFTDETVPGPQPAPDAFGPVQDNESNDGRDDRPRYGLHGDIKPENILWFRKDGEKSLPHLVISDFGLCKFISREWRSRIDAVHHEGSLTYRAPESDTELYRGLHYDIWSLGCVYLQSITWVLDGWAGVDDFSLRRLKDEKSLKVYNRNSPIPEDKFFVSYRRQFAGHDFGPVKAAIKPAVLKVVDDLQWIDRLHAHDRCTDYLHDFLKYIEDHMLVVPKNKREKSLQIVDYMKKLEQNIQDLGEDYILKPTPWTDPPVREDLALPTRPEDDSDDEESPLRDTTSVMMVGVACLCICVCSMLPWGPGPRLWAWQFNVF